LGEGASIDERGCAVDLGLLGGCKMVLEDGEQAFVALGSRGFGGL